MEYKCGFQVEPFLRARKKKCRFDFKIRRENFVSGLKECGEIG